MASGVNLLIVTHDSEDVLVGLLETLATGFGAVPVQQVVVVDCGSTDATVALAQALAPEATVLALDNVGYAAGINAGLEVVAGREPVLICNPDLRLGDDAVLALQRVLHEPGVGIAVPRVIDPAGRLQPSLRRRPTLWRALGEAVLGGDLAGRLPALGERVLGRSAYARPRRADWATGCAMLVSRKCLDAVGPWDASYFLYSEEVDFALRARDAGFALVYTPSAEVVHRGGDASRSPVLWRLMVLNRVRLYRSRSGAVAGLVYQFVVTAGEAVRAALGSARSHSALQGLLNRDLERAWTSTVAEVAWVARTVPGTGS